MTGMIMATLFVAGEAVETEALAALTGSALAELEQMIDTIIQENERKESGILLKRIGKKVQLCTNPKYADAIRALFAPEIRASLSSSVLETLSIVAYKQPVTRGEIDDIRGVRSNYAAATLIERGLIREIGRKDVLGRPALLATTDEFLRHFGISSLAELPVLDVEPENPELEQDHTQEEAAL